MAASTDSSLILLWYLFNRTTQLYYYKASASVLSTGCTLLQFPPHSPSAMRILCIHPLIYSTRPLLNSYMPLSVGLAIPKTVTSTLLRDSPHRRLTKQFADHGLISNDFLTLI